MTLTMDEALHREAMAKADAARDARATGRTKLAQDLFTQAADCEEQCASAVALDEPRTRGILAISAVSLRREAGELRRAADLAHRFLEEGLSPGFAREMHELLTDLEAEIGSLTGIPRFEGERAKTLLRALEQLEEELANGSVRRVPISVAA